MKNRLLIAILLIPAILGIVYLGYIPFLVFISMFVLLSAMEFWELVEKMGFAPRRIPGYIFITLILLAVYFQNCRFAAAYADELLGILFAVAIVVVFIYEILRNDISTALPSVAITILGIIYIGWLPSHFLLLRNVRPDGLIYVLMLLAMVWLGDSAAYFIGTAYGRHRLSGLSPKKTVEGSAASILVSILTVLLAKRFFIKEFTNADVIIFGVLISLSAQMGDLAESLIKRSAGEKDSSSILKEHGGILDKMDAFIFAAPMFYYYIKFVVLQ